MEYTLETLEGYKLAESFSDKIWRIGVEWDFFTKDAIGKQMVRAADTISANIAEGYGRYFYKESKQFYFYARGSIQETKAWLSKYQRRGIVDLRQSGELLAEAEKLLLKLNAFIKFLSKSQGKSPNAFS